MSDERGVLEDEINDALRYAEDRFEDGRRGGRTPLNLVSEALGGGRVSKAENADWFYAIHKYKLRGTATVECIKKLSQIADFNRCSRRNQSRMHAS